MPLNVSAYTALANVTLGSSASSVTFSSISSSYRDLILVMNPAKATAEGRFRLTINSDTNYSSNYFGSMMVGNGSSATGLTRDGNNFYLLSAAQDFSGDNLYIINFMDSSATDKQKMFLSRRSYADGEVNAAIFRWANTAAITSIKLHFLTDAAIAAGSNFALYGVSA
jgi:hypothetical protein